MRVLTRARAPLGVGAACLALAVVGTGLAYGLDRDAGADSGALGQASKGDAPHPEPFPEDVLNHRYASDELPSAPGGEDYFTWLLRSFNDARQDPEVLGPNKELPKGTSYDDLTARSDRIVVDTNNAPSDADAPEVERALVDGDNSPYVTMADGLGHTLGKLYGEALEDGQLPKTEALLASRVEKTPTSDDDWYQTAKDNYAYKRPFRRMGFINDEGLIKQWDSPEDYDGLADDGSFPSGHTSHGYAQGIVLATLLPQLAPQILARASEYGNNRILLAYHYPTDIMGGRIVGEKTAQHRWSDRQFRSMLQQAKKELRTVLAYKCRQEGAGRTLSRCVSADTPYLSTAEALKVYKERLTYGFPRTGDKGQPPSVPSGAEDLLRTAFPRLTDTQRRTVLAATQLPSGHVLDSRDTHGSWQRLNLAAALHAKVRTHDDGTLTVNGTTVTSRGTPVRNSG